MRHAVAVLAVLAALVPCAPITAHAQHESHARHEGHGGHDPVLGTVVFPNSGGEAAQRPFLRGVALLHSFEYERAAEAFREAQRADPGFALAYWGEALTYSHVLWRQEDLAASRAALARLGPTPPERLARAGTARERAFGAAVEAFFEEGTLAERVSAYADAMRAHSRSDPDDQEAAAFAAHAVMLASYMAGRDRREALTREAIELAQRVARANPDHPGAVHYLIHLYDNPGMAADGLEFARVYDRIAPDAPHAIHMPSHIYLQLGMWDDVASSNERAWAASRAGGGADWHAFAWLQYAYLQQGRWEAARALIDTARVVPATRSPAYVDVSFARTRLEFQYASETGRWETPIAPPPPPAEGRAMSERERAFRSEAAYWQAVDAAVRRDPGLDALAAPFLAEVEAIRNGAERPARVAANAFVVEALVALARGDRAAYVAGLEAGAEHERRLLAFVGPPERVFALELLATERLAEGRAAEAIGAFEDVLRLCPNRTPALLGLARALAAAGDPGGAAEARAAAGANWANADPDVAGLLDLRQWYESQIR